MPPKRYTFDVETHTHRIGDVIVPGITTVIKPLYDFGSVPVHIMEAAKQWGIAIHKMVELECKGELDMTTLDDALLPPLNEFRRWLADYGFKKSDFVCELPMGDAGLMVGCIPDLILDGKLIVEIKSRKPNMLTDSIQTVFQEHVWKKNGGERVKEYERRVLYLPPVGPYVYQKVNHKQAWSRCRKLIDHYYNIKMIESWRG